MKVAKRLSYAGFEVLPPALQVLANVFVDRISGRQAWRAGVALIDVVAGSRLLSGQLVLEAYIEYGKVKPGKFARRSVETFRTPYDKVRLDCLPCFAARCSLLTQQPLNARKLDVAVPEV